MGGTWFLPPNFTFTPDGPLRLGMVLPHWSRPTTVLAELGVGSASAVKPPATKTIVEPNRAFNRTESRSTSVALWAKFAGLASASTKTEVGKGRNVNYSETDHEIRFYVDPLTSDTVTAIANLPTVRAQIESGMFGKRPVYIVTGLRVATSSFTVTEETTSKIALENEASGPPSGTIPAEVGAGVNHSKEKSATNSYSTAPDIVFAYSLNIIRPHHGSSEAELFSHKSGFLTGDNGRIEEPLVLAEVSKQEIDGDIEESVSYKEEQVGSDDACIYIA